MSNEQKLREALQLCRAALDNLGLAATLRKYAIRTADEALATTEPEPTGMPEVKPWDHPEPQTMRWSDLEIRWIHSYGEQCWKAGYKHGAWGDKPEPTSKQSLQVEPAVNQQLTTEPVDERGAFEKWCAQYIYTRPALQESLGGYVPPDAVWAAWQARAAMAKGVKG